jgi:membrane protein implicated in regulation of membrane protease activity
LNASVIPILTALVVGYFFLEPPWRWLILIPAIAIDTVDIILWLRWRKRRAMTGEEGLIGTKGRLVSLGSNGEGTVKARGQLWKAEIEGNAQVQDEVVVAGVRGIRLLVHPVADEERKPAR